MSFILIAVRTNDHLNVTFVNTPSKLKKVFIDTNVRPNQIKSLNTNVMRVGRNMQTIDRF
jgi:hypothetical protein